MLRHEVKKWFIEAVRLDVKAPKELKDVLLRGHPNLDRFLDNITDQIEQAEKVLKARGKPPKRKTLQSFVYDMTQLFMQGMEGEARRRYESDIERLAREAKAEQAKQFEEALNGDLTDDFKEAGVVIHDERKDFKIEAET